MEISLERTLWILNFYRKNDTLLVFGGRILGEQAICLAKVAYVWPETRAIGIRLLSDDRQEEWDRLIALTNAEFSLGQLGDSLFENLATTDLHSVLSIRFPDGTAMFLAERS